MAIIQSLNTTGIETFSDIGAHVKTIVTSNGNKSNILIIVPDRYDISLSIKTYERSRRKQAVSYEVKILNDNQKFPGKI